MAALESRSVPKLRPPSRRAAIIVFEDTAQSFVTADDMFHVGRVARFLDQLVVESLVIALKVIMLHEFLYSFAKMACAQRNNLGQTF